jgi:NAD(P)-dependent dehydrogenase (short-subunit alcohol dehydrogenase family)
LVNNAGYLEEWKPIAESDPAEWWKTWDVNVRGVYLVSRAFIPLLLANDSGLKTIVNVSSAGAHRTRPGASGYQNSKFAVLRFTEFLNAEYGEKGLLPIVIHPGGVMTELAKAMPKDMHGVLTNTPELCGDFVPWLTEQRREWLAGRYVSVNWDVEELESKKKEIVDGDKLKMRMVF